MWKDRMSEEQSLELGRSDVDRASAIWAPWLSSLSWNLPLHGSPYRYLGPFSCWPLETSAAALVLQTRHKYMVLMLAWDGPQVGGFQLP